MSSHTVSPDSGHGPSFPPPVLAEPWLAQWDHTAGKYYFVNRETRISQWERPVFSADAPSPSSTPLSTDSSTFTPPPRAPTEEDDVPSLTATTRALREVTAPPLLPAEKASRDGTPTQPLPSVSPSQGFLSQVASDLASREVQNHPGNHTQYSGSQFPEEVSSSFSHPPQSHGHTPVPSSESNGIVVLPLDSSRFPLPHSLAQQLRAEQQQQQQQQQQQRSPSAYMRAQPAYHPGYPPHSPPDARYIPDLPGAIPPTFPAVPVPGALNSAYATADPRYPAPPFQPASVAASYPGPPFPPPGMPDYHRFQDPYGHAGLPQPPSVPLGGAGSRYPPGHEYYGGTGSRGYRR